MQLWRASNGKWYEVACPGGGVEYVAVPKEKYAEVQAALAGAEELLAEIAAKYEGGYPHITHVIGQSAERIRDQIRAAQKVNEEAEDGT